MTIPYSERHSEKSILHNLRYEEVGAMVIFRLAGSWRKIDRDTWTLWVPPNRTVFSRSTCSTVGMAKGMAHSWSIGDVWEIF